jgi:hypothetical protein
LEPEKLIALAIAIGTWIVSIFPESEPSRHDYELFATFTQTITPDWTTWLRRHDFGGSFAYSQARPLFEIDGRWDGVSYSFDDPVLKDTFDELVEQIVGFAHLLARNTWPIAGTELQTAVPDGEPSFEEPHVQARVKRLNVGATALVARLDHFVVLARRRLNASSKLSA